MFSRTRTIAASALLFLLVLCGSTPNFGAASSCTNGCGFILNGEPQSSEGASFTFDGDNAGTLFNGAGRIWISRVENRNQPVGIIIASGWGVTATEDPDIATLVKELRARIPGLVIITMNLTYTPGYQGTPTVTAGISGNAHIIQLQANILERLGVQSDQIAVIGQNKGGVAAIAALKLLTKPPCLTVVAGTGFDKEGIGQKGEVIEAISNTPQGNRIFATGCNNDTVTPTKTVEALTKNLANQRIATALTIYDSCDSTNPHGALLTNDQFLTNITDLIYKACS